MDIDPVELCKLQAEIVGHRHRVARLLEDVDTLRRSVDQSGAANLTGRTGTVLDLCTSQSGASDAANGPTCGSFKCGPITPGRGM